MPCGSPPSRASACVVPGECVTWPRVAWRDALTTRNSVSAVSGMLSVLTISGWSNPLPYQPTAALLLMMNIAARSMCLTTSVTRAVRTSERLAPFSIAAIEAFRPE